ncbi:MAG: hypothetical protein NVSMB66_2850 [Candidatus Doudnabacteria bacterium]
MDSQENRVHQPDKSAYQLPPAFPNVENLCPPNQKSLGSGEGAESAAEMEETAEQEPRLPNAAPCHDYL